jgi:hypothetical protein
VEDFGERYQGKEAKKQFACFAFRPIRNEYLKKKKLNIL